MCEMEGRMEGRRERGDGMEGRMGRRMKGGK